MLDRIREQSRNPILVVAFGIIILVFIAYFGPGSSGCLGMGSGIDAPYSFAAKVNGQEISSKEFTAEYQQLLAMYKGQPGFTEALAEQLRLKDQVLDRLVDRELLTQVARQHGLSVGDAEVAQEIRKIDAFKKDGKFDFETYRQVVEYSVGLAPDKFEDKLREDLVRQKLIAQLRAGAKVTDDEILAEFVKDNDKANLDFVRFQFATYRAEAIPTEEEVQAYLASDAGKKAVEEDYKKKIFRFKKPKRVKAQHILVKAAEDAPAAEVEAARKKLLDAKREIEGGKDFGEVAQAISEDPSNKDKGGDLGFFGPGTMAKPFEEAAMALEAGKMSDVVRTRFGFHLILVNEVQPAEEKKLEEVQPELARELLGTEKAKLVAHKKAEDARAAAAAGKKLAELFPAPPQSDEAPAAPAQQAPFAEETGLFSLGSDYVPKVGANAELTRDVATSTTPGQVLPKVYELTGAVMVAQVKERQKADPTQLEAKKDEYRERVRGRKELALVESFTKKLREKATIEKNPTVFASTAAAPPDDQG